MLIAKDLKDKSKEELQEIVERYESGKGDVSKSAYNLAKVRLKKSQ